MKNQIFFLKIIDQEQSLRISSILQGFSAQKLPSEKLVFNCYEGKKEKTLVKSKEKPMYTLLSLQQNQDRILLSISEKTKIPKFSYSYGHQHFLNLIIKQKILIDLENKYSAKFNMQRYKWGTFSVCLLPIEQKKCILIVREHTVFTKFSKDLSNLEKRLQMSFQTILAVLLQGFDKNNIAQFVKRAMDIIANQEEVKQHDQNNKVQVEIVFWLLERIMILQIFNQLLHK